MIDYNKHPRMPVAQRAKQFMPFDALPGFREALKRKEFEMGLTEKKDLSDDAEEAINETLSDLMAGDLIKVTYYKEEDRFEGGTYITSEGSLAKVDPVFRTLTLTASGEDGGDSELEIRIEDIESIERI